ncbi:MAG: hypothetical protein RLZZ303_1639 [Candidatus Hydrogenedentota bacterium]
MRFRRLMVLMAAALAACGARAATPDKPNIVVFLVDDMGWQDTSVPFWEERTPFNDHFRTPNMERLTAKGIKFTNARAHAVCSPTRTSIMTGQSPIRHHVTNWTLRTDEETSREGGPTGPPPQWRREGIQAGETTVAQCLREAGYRTIHAGKAHWGAVGTSGSDPRNLGFDVNIGGHSAGAPASYQGKKNFGNHENSKDQNLFAVPGLEAYHGKDIHLTDAITAEARKAVASAVDDGKPFYLYMAHYAVHTPIEPHGRFMPHYQGRNYTGTEIDIPKVEEEYASMIEGMDASLGEILDMLESLGVAKDTIVFFTSDNGGLSAHARGTTPMGTGLNTHCWPLKAGKGSAYEGGTRVPFLAAWAQPAADNAFQSALPIPAASSSPQPVISEDLFPTLLGIAGVGEMLPRDYPVDGQDIRPWLTQSAIDLDRPLYFHYPHVWGPEGPGYQPHSAAVFGEWKVIHYYNDNSWELYNLKEDLGEKDNLAKAQPERLANLAARLHEHLTELGAQWPVLREGGAEVPMKLPGLLKDNTQR